MRWMKQNEWTFSVVFSVIIYEAKKDTEKNTEKWAKILMSKSDSFVD